MNRQHVVVTLCILLGAGTVAVIRPWLLGATSEMKFCCLAGIICGSPEDEERVEVAPDYPGSTCCQLCVKKDQAAEMLASGHAKRILGPAVPVSRR